MFVRMLLVVCVFGCADNDAARGPLEDCRVQTDNTLVCPDSLPRCVLQADRAVQFEHCGRRHEYVVYGRDADCPEVFYYPEGSFLSPEDWASFAGACNSRER